MRVLVSNDDGVDAPGIRHLAEALRAAGHEVTVVAPDRDRSGASNSLTLDQPIRAVRRANDIWSVAGTPTDCVHLALSGMLEAEPDIVVSGINNTANLGDDVIYSGTVAAAMEGRFLGLPAIAMSLASVDHKAQHYETRRARRGGDHRAPDHRSAAGRHHPQRQRAGPCLGGDPRLRSHAAWAIAIAPSPASSRTIRAVDRSGGSARPDRRRTPVPAPISMPCATASSPSRRSTST